MEVPMSTASLTANAYGVRQISGQRLNALGKLLNAYSAWRLRHKQLAELYGLSDSTLKDIGICRTEIEGIVRSPKRDASGRAR